MSSAATIHNFSVQLADVDRGVYESLDFKVARQSTETETYLLTRVLAYCLEYAEGIVLSPGLNEPDAPTIAVKDLTGSLQVWIDIGVPDAARMHKASKASPRVAVYTHKPQALVKALAGEKIHRAEALELYAPDSALIEGLARRLDRRMSFELSRSDGSCFITVGGETLSGEIARLSLVATDA